MEREGVSRESFLEKLDLEDVDSIIFVVLMIPVLVPYIEEELWTLMRGSRLGHNVNWSSSLCSRMLSSGQALWTFTLHHRLSFPLWSFHISL